MCGCRPCSAKNRSIASRDSSTPSTWYPFAANQAMSSDLPASGTNTFAPAGTPSDGQCLSSSGVGADWWKPIWLSCQRWCQKSGFIDPYPMWERL
jgi:hypothetical protein